MGYGSPAWKFEVTPIGRTFVARSYSRAEPVVRSSSRAFSRFAISRARAVMRSVSASMAMRASSGRVLGSDLPALQQQVGRRHGHPRHEDDRPEHEDLRWDAH